MIDWEHLKNRLNSHRSGIDNVLANSIDTKCVDGTYQEAKNYRQRTVQQSSQASAGYYGPRGMDILYALESACILYPLTTVFRRSDYIAYEYSSNIRAAALTRSSISSIGVPAYILTKLVPELAIGLIAEDMKVSRAEAYTIFEESKKIGEILNDND